jgi:hypothetical protein
VFAGVLGLFAVMGSRRWFTVVVTDRNVHLLKNRGMNVPVAVETVAGRVDGGRLCRGRVRIA